MAVSTQVQLVEPVSTQWPAQLDSAQFPTLHALGDVTLLSRSLLGIFCSSQCPGDVILGVYEAIKSIRDRGLAVAGGFHSPMEQECLDLLLRGKGPIVVAPARGVGKMRVPKQWRTLIDRGQLLVVSPFSDEQITTTLERAKKRNQFVAQLSQSLFVPHAAPGSKTEGLCEEWLQRGKDVYLLNSKCTTLFDLGAQSFDCQHPPFANSDRGYV